MEVEIVTEEWESEFIESSRIDKLEREMCPGVEACLIKPVYFIE